MDTTRIMLVEDHPVVREGLARILSEVEGWEVIAQADNAGDAMQAYREHKPDICMVDLGLKKSNGLELTKQVRAFDREALILILSVHPESTYAERALRAGARGYLRKDSDPDEIRGALKEILAGRLFLSHNLSQQLLMRLVGAELSEDPIDQLSDRELQVFELLGRAMTTKEIAEQLGLSPKTIETYRENIKQKLSLKNAAELSHRASLWVLESS